MLGQSGHLMYTGKYAFTDLIKKRLSDIFVPDRKQTLYLQKFNSFIPKELISHLATCSTQNQFSLLHKASQVCLYEGKRPQDQMSPLKSHFIAKASWLLDSSEAEEG